MPKEYSKCINTTLKKFMNSSSCPKIMHADEQNMMIIIDHKIRKIPRSISIF